MFRIPTLIYVLLIAATTINSTRWLDCASTEAKRQSPADQPANVGEEKEESSNKSELTDGDDFEAFAIALKGSDWKLRRWALHDLEEQLTLRICRHGSGHCRAPPAPLG